jgi:hypothetical protein
MHTVTAVPHAGSNRTTGLQAAHLGLAAQLDALQAQLAPHEFAVLVDLHARVVARKQRSCERWLERTGRVAA